MFKKDTVRMIKKTLNRFLSILTISIIGVAFMMGLFSIRFIMEDSVDHYDDQQKLQDIQIYSSYGFDENDIEELSKQDFVKEMFASKMRDVYGQTADGYSAVTRVEELDRDMNLYELIEGRMPERDDEVLILGSGTVSGSYELGDVIKLYLEDEDILDILKYDEYTIVGRVQSAAYISHTMGTSLLKNQELESVLYINNDNFLSEYYTTVYLTVNDADKLFSFSNEYEVFMEEASEDVASFAVAQQDQLKDKLLDEYREKIEEGEKELEEKKAEGQQQLDDAKEELDEALIQIVSTENNITMLEGLLKTVEAQQEVMENQYSGNIIDVGNRVKEIEDNDPEGRSFDEIYSEVVRDYSTYMALKSVESGEYDEEINRLKEENVSINNQINALESERAELEERLQNGDLTVVERIAEIDRELAELRIQLEVNNRLIDSMEEISQSTSPQARMAEIDAKYGGSVEDTYAEYSALQEDKVIYDLLEDEIRAADEAFKELDSQIKTLKAQVSNGRKQYEEGLKEYNKGVLEFNLEIEKAELEIRKAYQDLEELPAAKWMILDRDSHYATAMYAQNTKQMGAIGITLPLLFYLVAALVCLTTMTRLVDEQRGQIGVFRALGFSRKQIIAKYVVYALIATVIGSIIGIPVGMAIFPRVVYNVWRILYDLPPMITTYPLSNIVICLLAFTLLMGVVTALIVNNTLNEVPSQLMRPKAPKNSKGVFLEKITFIWKRLSFTGKVTARNLIRYKARFFMTIIGVAGCTGLLVIGWGVKDSIADVVNLQFENIFNYDYNVYIESDTNLEEITAVLKSNLDNESIVPMMNYASKVYIEDEPTINVVVIDARDSSNVFSLRSAGKKEDLRIRNSGVIISEKFAKNHNLKKGDTITIESSNGIKAEVKITEICEMYFEHYLYISNECYENTFAEHVHPNVIAVKNSSGQFDDSKIKEVEGYSSVVDFSSMIETFDVMIQALDYIILVIIITAGSLAFVVLISLTQVNISERVREIATLKVLGFHRKEIYSYIFREIFTLSLIGGLIGLPLGVLEHHFIMTVISMEMVMFGNVIKLHTYLYAYGITILFTIIVMIMSRKSLDNVEMIESLKSVE